MKVGAWPQASHTKPPMAGPAATPLCVARVTHPKAEPRASGRAAPATYAPLAGRKSEEVRPDRTAHR